MSASSSVKKVSSFNPLRALREQLGSRGKRLSTYKLSALVNVPGPTLRSIEIGRNAFTEGIQQRLRWRGMSWDQKSKCWTFTYNPGLPLTVDLITSFNRLGRGSSLNQDLDARALCVQLITLLQTVPTPVYSALVLNLRDVLSRLRAEYKAVGREEIFAEMTPMFSYVETQSGAQTLSKEYTWRNPPEPHRVLDLCHLQKSSAVLDEDEHDQSSSSVQPAA